MAEFDRPLLAPASMDDIEVIVYRLIEEAGVPKREQTDELYVSLYALISRIAKIKGQYEDENKGIGIIGGGDREKGITLLRKAQKEFLRLADKSGHIATPGSVISLNDYDAHILTGSVLKETTIEGTGADILLKLVDFSNSTFNKCQFESCTLSGALLKEARVARSQWTDSKCMAMNAEKAEFNSSFFIQSDFRHMQAAGAEFNQCTFKESNLKGASLENAVFSEGKGSDLNLQGAMLSNTRFEGTILTYINAIDTHARGIHFNNCQLNSVDFRDAVLREAVFVDTDAEVVNFLRTDLRGANLRGLSGVNINQLACAYVDETTQLPNHETLEQLEQARRDIAAMPVGDPAHPLPEGITPEHVKQAQEMLRSGPDQAEDLEAQHNDYFGPTGRVIKLQDAILAGKTKSVDEAQR